MPTYEYECEACGYGFDIMQSMKDEKLNVCPECLQPSLIRLISGGAIVIVKGPPDHINVPGANSSESKKRRHVKAMEALASQPMTDSEQQAAYEQGLEREKDMGFKEGHASGGRAPIVSVADRATLTKEQIDKKISTAKSEGRERIAVSQKARKRII